MCLYSLWLYMFSALTHCLAVVGDLSVHVSSAGVHSGDASGIVPDSFRIVRQLIGRLEDQETGRCDDMELTSLLCVFLLNLFFFFSSSSFFFLLLAHCTTIC